tara:strand:+ start:1367 stop:1966 length:600 start_codon:yes stop_codon:yes gene_type:complete
MLDYTKRAENYDKRWQHYCLPSFSKPLQILDLNGDSTLLDVGCGTGIFLEILEKKFPYTKFSGLDPNQAMLAKASEKLSSKVDLKIGNAESLPHDSQSFDWVVLSNCFGHINDQETALFEAHRVLRKNGKIIITDWTRDFLVMRIVNLYTQLFDDADYKSLKSSETTAMLEKLDFKCLSVESYKINWFWGLYTILGAKR